MTNSLGRLIMFDGPDGVGKTTQLNLVANALTAEGYEIYLTKTHGGTPIGEALREVSLAMHAQLSQLIEDKRERGIIVLVDRSPLSNVAYQAYGSGLDIDFSMGIIDIDMQLFKPDCIIVYDAPIAITKGRMMARNLKNKAKKEYFESKSNEYFERVAEGYRAAAAHFGATVIEAVASIDSIHKETMKVVNKCLR